MSVWSWAIAWLVISVVVVGLYVAMLEVRLYTTHVSERENQSTGESAMTDAYEATETPPHPSYTVGGKADWSLIPGHMIGALRRYIEYGIPPGGFLTAVLSNDLKMAFQKADDENRASIESYVKFLYMYAPTECWGSSKRFHEWSERGGLNGWSR